MSEIIIDAIRYAGGEQYAMRFNQQPGRFDHYWDGTPPLVFTIGGDPATINPIYANAWLANFGGNTADNSEGPGSPWVFTPAPNSIAVRHYTAGGHGVLAGFVTPSSGIIIP